jgi:hypothetical protein
MYTNRLHTGSCGGHQAGRWVSQSNEEALVSGKLQRQFKLVAGSDSSLSHFMVRTHPVHSKNEDVGAEHIFDTLHRMTLSHSETP